MLKNDEFQKLMDEAIVRERKDEQPALELGKQLSEEDTEYPLITRCNSLVREIDEDWGCSMVQKHTHNPPVWRHRSQTPRDTSNSISFLYIAHFPGDTLQNFGGFCEQLSGCGACIRRLML
eukprot:2027123-Amphidinium_carterae.3